MNVAPLKFIVGWHVWNCVCIVRLYTDSDIDNVTKAAQHDAVTTINDYQQKPWAKYIITAAAPAAAFAPTIGAISCSKLNENIFFLWKREKNEILNEKS